MTTPASPDSLRAHRRVLGTGYLLFALYPGFMGVTLLLDWVRQLDEWSALLDPTILLSLLLLGAAGALTATVMALLRGGTWAVWTSLVVALPVSRVYPFGTALAAYACWVAYTTWRAGREAPQPA